MGAHRALWWCDEAVKGYLRNSVKLLKRECGALEKQVLTMKGKRLFLGKDASLGAVGH